MYIKQWAGENIGKHTVPCTESKYKLSSYHSKKQRLVMKLTRLRCPNCGADFENVDLEQDQRIFKCTRMGCGAAFIVDQGAKFAYIEKREAEKIEQYRREMNRALSPFDSYLAMRYAENIITILPNDFRAKAVLSIAQSNDSNKRPLYNFLSSESDCTTEEFEEVFPVILNHCDYRALKLLEESAKRIPDSPTKSRMQAQISDQMAYLKKKNDDYADVPRDVFICHSSEDIDIAMNVMQVLENDGNTCWISERNMPPDSRYYWEKIEKSIRHCSIFLVLCSGNAMHSDAVQREISIAESSDVERLELKLDNTPHTVLFKHFFDGLNWIDATKDTGRAFSELMEWVFQLKHPQTAAGGEDTGINKPNKQEPAIQPEKIEKGSLPGESRIPQERDNRQTRTEKKPPSKLVSTILFLIPALLSLLIGALELGLFSKQQQQMGLQLLHRQRLGYFFILEGICFFSAWLLRSKRTWVKWFLFAAGILLNAVIFKFEGVNPINEGGKIVTSVQNSVSAYIEEKKTNDPASQNKTGPGSGEQLPVITITPTKIKIPTNTPVPQDSQLIEDIPLRGELSVDENEYLTVLPEKPGNWF